MTLFEYIEQHSTPENSALSAITSDTYRNVLNPHMLSGQVQGRVLSMLSCMIRPRRILELGTFTGYSALCLAEGLTEDGLLYTIDHNDELEDTVRHNLSLSPLGTKIRPLIGDALEILNSEAINRSSAAITGEAINIYIVNESGASIYSASKIGREEFPNEDVTVRGAVSIGRRLMDPLAELVKIDPKSIGVGQYQHDVDQTRLRDSLNQTVESVVNYVGVDVNTASRHLLTYISGLGPTLAQNIVDYRAANGAFQTRQDLKKVPKLGPKAFEQCAGFLRIAGGKNPLDNTAVHPESYAIIEALVKRMGCTVKDLIASPELQQQADALLSADSGNSSPFSGGRGVLQLLPSRDPRSEAEVFHFSDSVHTIDDLQEGMRLPGIVTNISAFGAFVDLGIHKDGLIHISEMANRRISNPSEVVKLHQHVEVRVLSIDRQRGRIALSLKNL